MLKNNIGFSLIELIITLAIGSIVALILTQTLMAYNKSYSHSLQAIEMEQNAKAIVDTIGFYILNAGYDPIDKGIPSIIDDSDSSYLHLYFPIDKDKNGFISTAEAEEEIEFYFDKEKGVLLKNNIVFSDNIAEISFDYIPSINKIESIIVNVITRTAIEDPNLTTGYNLVGTPEDGTCLTFTLTSRVNLRN